MELQILSWSSTVNCRLFSVWLRPLQYFIASSCRKNCRTMQTVCFLSQTASTTSLKNMLLLLPARRMPQHMNCRKRIWNTATTIIQWHDRQKQLRWLSPKQCGKNSMLKMWIVPGVIMARFAVQLRLQNQPDTYCTLTVARGNSFLYYFMLISRSYFCYLIVFHCHQWFAIFMEVETVDGRIF